MKKTLLLPVLILFILFSLSASAQGFTCADPIQITSLPFNTEDDTANYWDLTDVSQPSSCTNATGNYMSGNEVFYAISPTSDGVINISMTPNANGSGIFVYDGCNNVGVNCKAGVANSNSDVRVISGLTLYAGHQYIIVISSSAPQQTVGYTLNIEVNSCSAPSEVASGDVFPNSVNLGWFENGTATSWEVLVLPSGSPAPNAASTGTVVSTNPNTTVSGLTPSTIYTAYVRALCSQGNYSTWSSSPIFKTSCESFSVPFQQGFNNSNDPVESCWTVWNFNGDGDFWNMNYTLNPYEGAQCAILYTDGNTGNNSDWLVSPSIILNGNQQLKYHYRVQSATEPNNFRVMLSTNGANLSGFTTTLLPLTSYSNTTYVQQTVSLAGYTGPVNIAWNVPPGSLDGWRLYIDNVIVEDIPTCPPPTNLNSISSTSSSVTLGWTNNSTATSWELIALPYGEVPTAADSGQLVTTNPAVISGLSPLTMYSFYVRAICSATDFSIWSTRKDIATAIPNDDCASATTVPVNQHYCTNVVTGILTGATASSPAIASPCIGVADDDVWFKFVAVNASANIALLNISGSTTNLNMGLYSGSCGALTQLTCSANGITSMVVSNLSVGSTYYVRVYSNASTAQDVYFNICISTPPNCIDANPICGVTNYLNLTGVGSLGTIGCLSSTPNPTYFSLRVGMSGSINLQLTQSSLANSGPANLDVDYAAWGPFASQSDACAAINSGQAPGIGVPVTLTTGCSFSASPTEYLNIQNAVAGQYYIILITNYSDDPGYISVVQTNNGAVGSGTMDCSGIRLNAFLDSNANGVKDSGEVNFGLGQFHYEKNNDGNNHSITAPSGTYAIYDYYPTNNYNLSYTINADYSSLYSSNTTYTNINTTNAGVPYNYFPVTLVQNYNDLGVSIVPMSSPRAGTSYKNKIVFTNNGSQALASGSLTFTVNTGTSITAISETGTVAIPNGFTYAFTNLMPFETRSIMVTIAVPAIPAVSIGQLLTNTVSVVPPSGDVLLNNNTNASTQAVIAAYDPNDKLESHGEEILFSSFTPNDYLEYTIRFENTGNATAFNVVVNDVLDTKLDAGSIVMLHSSHNYVLDRLNNTLIWNFNGIMLPVSVANTDTGKGFIKFKIKPKPGYAIGDIIPNTAQIYFDSNPAIVTNTFNTRFVATLSHSTFTENDVVVFPNPANTSIQVNITNSNETLKNIAVYDVLGKRVKMNANINSNQTVMDVADLARGIYMVEITSESNLKLIKKLIIQ